ncbi:MAG TPA: histidinol dehydrogenase, partial [Gammaproteobacteria bacterium]|nr:histidinol dehydrogenase [Gammaproteobacteria bacterium]
LSLANKVNKKIIPLLVNLKRKSIIAKSLSYSRIILVNKLEDAFDICNTYAPEHLILQLNEPRNYLSKIQTAGAIFLGALTPETLGDYVTGSNHVLPTYGFAKSYSGLAVDDYMTFISVQESNLAGLQNLGQHAIILAELEGLDAHKSAISIRLKSEGTMRE